MPMTDKPSEQESTPDGITAIGVKGFKSIRDELRIEIRPLTLLAGANSSGKSSVIQPLLLLKQTLDSPYDPGPLLLNGPHVRFTSGSQMVSVSDSKQRTHELHLSLESNEISLGTTFKWSPKRREQPFAIQQMTIIQGEELRTLRPGMTDDEVTSSLPSNIKEFYAQLISKSEPQRLYKYVLLRDRCFLSFGLSFGVDDDSLSRSQPIQIFSVDMLRLDIQEVIHVPGLRGNPERTYPITSVGHAFPGTFEQYVASAIVHWQQMEDTRLHRLTEWLRGLGLTSSVKAEFVDETQVDLQVGRLARGGAKDLVSIADVGFGVPQSLPVLVALLVAKPGQIVYLEQPELHLHPRAQVAMASLLADAAKRGVRVVAETHSDLLLRGVQTEVAEGNLSPDLVKLHWFTRKSDGTTKIDSADLDRDGAFGDWPSDFDAVQLKADSRYLDAATNVHTR